MGMMACRECGKPVSSEAPSCPHCGVLKPVKPEKPKQVGGWGIAAALVVGFFFFKACSPNDPPPARPAAQSAAPVKSPEAIRQEQAAAERERVAKMTPAQTVEYLRPKLLVICQAMNRQYNHIEVRQRGDGLYCVHEFYSQYTLSAGPLAQAMQAYINEYRGELLKAKVKKVGVYGRGEFASGQWYVVD